MIRATHNFWHSLPSTARDRCHVRDTGQHAHKRWYVSPWAVVSDPTGDFRRGAEFGQWDVEHMLRQGNFEHGTRLARNGREYEVRCGELVEVTP